MPPKGYDTVTLPVSVVAMIDDRVENSYCESRAEAIRTLLESSETRVSSHVESVEDGVIEDIAGRTAARAVDEMEGRMR
jgi:Arc/MetJ-type ribon-helix-helix transcriptional regulator